MADDEPNLEGPMTLPPGLSREVKHGLGWVVAAGFVASMIGVQFPWQITAEANAEWVRAQAVVQAQLEAQEVKIAILQERDMRVQAELVKITGKLDEMAMVLYSLERRTR